MKYRKLFFSNLLIFAVGGFMLACGGEKASTTSQDSSQPVAASQPEAEVAAEEKKPSNRRGQLIYKQYCVICHGADGKLGVNGANDLTVSTLSIEERINQVTNGKGLMTPFKDILSAEQIEAVVLYLEELR